MTTKICCEEPHDACEMLKDIFLGEHDKMIKSIVSNFPTGSYKMRVKDPRIAKQFSKVT